MRGLARIGERRVTAPVTAIAALAIAAALAGAADAATPSGSVSADDYRGPNDQHTRAVLGIAGLSFGSGDVLGGAMRFDDAAVGTGYGIVMGGGVPLAGPASLRVVATRFLGDQGYRAWRVKAGPQWGLPGGGTLGMFYLHDSNNLGTSTESGSGELTMPLVSRLNGRLAGSYGRSADVDGFAVSLGAGWTPIPHLELTGDLGLARNPPASTPGPGGHGTGLLNNLLGQGRGSSNQTTDATSDAIAATTELSLRVSFP